ncbi:MAG: hypothetical protein SFU98_17320 [Leptospiraceae bacterium]|nr:hypothetical protein [Leptospiraceae bacterium]
MYNFDDFLNFYGCPAIVLPQNIAKFWYGIMEPVSFENVSSPDFITEEGLPFQVVDEMDFDDPKTDYDLICHLGLRTHKTNFLFSFREDKYEALCLNIDKNRILWISKLMSFVWIDTVENIQNISLDLEQLNQIE